MGIEREGVKDEKRLTGEEMGRDLLTSTSSRRQGSVSEMYANQRHIVMDGGEKVRFRFVSRL